MYKKQMLVGVLSTYCMLTMHAQAQPVGTDYVAQCKAQLASYKADLEASQLEDQKEAFEAAVALEVEEQQKAKAAIQAMDVAHQSSGMGEEILPSAQSSLKTGTPDGALVVAAPEATKISFNFHQGRLKDQVETFLSIHAPEIQTFIWSADENLLWVNDFLAEGESYRHILSRILKSYDLGAKKYGNDVIEILPRGALGK